MFFDFYEFRFPPGHCGYRTILNTRLRVPFTDNVMARAVGIEPTLEVLETPVLPLYDAR